MEPTLERLASCAEPYRSISASLLARGFDTHHLQSNATRLFLPFETANGTQPTEEEQAEFDSWLINQYYDLLTSSDTDTVDVLFAGGGLTDHQGVNLIYTDAGFALGSALMVYLVMIIHTRSIFLATAGMIQIILSFPLCYFIFRVIIAMPRTNVLNFLGLFIILGIGADNIFIFVDAWRQSELEDDSISSSNERRLAWTYSRSVKTMAVTTSSTFFAFIANAISIIPPIRYFGIFVGMLVAANFLLVCSWFPAAIVLNDKTFDKIHILENLNNKIQKRSRTLLFPLFKRIIKPSKTSKPKNQTNIEMNESELNLKEKDSSFESEKSNHDKDNTEFNENESNTNQQNNHVQHESVSSNNDYDNDTDNDEPSKEVDDEKEYRFIEYFFYHYYSKVIFKYRYFIVGFFALITVAGIVGTAFIKPASEPAQFVPEWHNIEKFFTISSESFAPSFSGRYSVVINLVWGIDGIDRSTRDLSDIQDHGTPIYNDKFSFT
eukprot:gb/GECH01008165.1/.p1 GENE.gb/GECH01008165.1/~~gb/GECH01008165.1/.p1  ORF type:complete len:493 (+),score=101.51 gb/GECH01008165.1/:1-1479(+)